MKIKDCDEDFSLILLAEMSLFVFQTEMDKYLTTLAGETTRALDAMENHVHQLGPEKQNQFKIGFLKSANYQYVSVIKHKFSLNIRSWFSILNFGFQFDGNLQVF